MKVEDVTKVQDTVLADLHVLRIAEGQLKDPRTTAGQLAKKSVEILAKAFGDWSTSDAKGVLARWDKASETADKILKGLAFSNAAGHDLEELSHGKWTLANSQVLDRAIHWVADDGITTLLKKLSVLKGADPGAIGFGDIADGVTKQIHDGNFTIDALEHYMDASVRASWFSVGILVSGGNVRVAKLVSDLAAGVVNWTRDKSKAITASLYQKYFGTEIADAFDEWQVAQLDNARQGKALVTWEDWAVAAGFDVHAKPELKEEAAEIFSDCQRLTNAHAVVPKVKGILMPANVTTRPVDIGKFLDD